MSWKTAGALLRGPPTSNTGGGGSEDRAVAQRLKPNLGGLTAFQREQQLARRYADIGRGEKREGKTEWDVLRENHRFIRDDELPGDVSWEERLARAYESKLFKEFALIDLKHYKTSRLALRWRTAPEVISSIGEDTCASLRCKYHLPASSSSSLSPSPPPRTGDRVVGWEDTPGPSDSVSVRGARHSDRREKRGRKVPALKSFELPFKYEEGGEVKQAMVKVRVCRRCEGKLLWGRGKAGEEKGSGAKEENSGDEECGSSSDDHAEAGREVKRKGGSGRDGSRSPRRRRRERPRDGEDEERDAGQDQSRGHRRRDDR